MHFPKFFFALKIWSALFLINPSTLRGDFQVASPLQYPSINTQAGDEITDTDQFKDVISPNLKFSKPVLKEMYRNKKGELLIRSWRWGFKGGVVLYF